MQFAKRISVIGFNVLMVACISTALAKNSAVCSNQYASTVNDQASTEQASEILRKKYSNSIFSVATERSFFVAEYVVGFRKRIEDTGNKYFRNDIKDHHGKGLAIVTVDAEGQVLEVNLLKSTGTNTLDMAILKMVCHPNVHLAFSEGLREKTSVLHIALPFSFEHETESLKQSKE